MSIDAIELAKEYQWEIGLIEDPVEASLKSTEALRTLEHITDERLRLGRPVVVSAMSGLILNHWLESEQKHISLQLDEIVGQGESAGISFIQNLGRPKLQSLFVVLRNSDIVEVEKRVDGVETIRFTPPIISIPVLDLSSIELAA